MLCCLQIHFQRKSFLPRSRKAHLSPALGKLSPGRHIQTGVFRRWMRMAPSGLIELIKLCLSQASVFLSSKDGFADSSPSSVRPYLDRVTLFLIFLKWFYVNWLEPGKLAKISQHRDYKTDLLDKTGGAWKERASKRIQVSQNTEGWAAQSKRPGNTQRLCLMISSLRWETLSKMETKA